MLTGAWDAEDTAGHEEERLPDEATPDDVIDKGLISAEHAERQADEEEEEEDEEEEEESEAG